MIAAANGAKSKEKLPAGWRWAKLGALATIVTKGTTPTSLGHAYTDLGIPFLRAEDINGGAVDPEGVSFHISHETDQLLARSRLLPGDFLITIAGTLGRVGYVPEGAPAMNCNQAVAFARLDRNAVDIDYLTLACQHECVIAPLLDMKAGGALQNLNLQQVRTLEVPLPPLPEQKRIAAILNEQMAAVERARKAAEEELETINRLPAALLRRAFEGEL
jgi:type I restriction enzyme, S subunit